MTGKIFAESSNIYQDQARILFNYYSQAAEKIVMEEERLEQEIALLEQERLSKQQEIAKLWVWFLTVILFFVYYIKKGNLEKQIAVIDSRINEFKKLHDEIFRDYKVTKLGVAYVPVADQIKYEDKSFIVDYTGKIEESELTLQLSRQNDLLIETIANLENLSSRAPIVETSEDTEAIETDRYSTSIQEIRQHDYFGKLERSLRTISYCMDDLDTSSVSLPLVASKSEYLQYLNEYATVNIPENAVLIEVFDKEKYLNSINKFQELNKLKDSLSTKTAQFEDVLKGLMVTMASSVQAISALKIASTDKMIFESNKVLYQILKSPYNHYSPLLEYGEIERIRQEKFNYTDAVQSYEPFQLKPSSRVRYNLSSGSWTAEDGSITNSPFGMHQFYEEIVAPVVQSLMNENRIERLKIYNHIKDQKIDYLNKWHQDTDSFYRANRAESADVINLMQTSLREYVAAYNTLVSLQKTENSMVSSGGSLEAAVVEANNTSAESLAAFELQSQEFQRVQTDFENYMERLKEDIDLKAETFGHVEYYDAKLRDGNANELAVATHEIHDLDVRRRPLASVNPLFAKTSNLPPAPQIEEITFEHISLNLPVIARQALEELQNNPDPAADFISQEISDESLPEEHFDASDSTQPEASIIEAAPIHDSENQDIDALNSKEETNNDIENADISIESDPIETFSELNNDNETSAYGVDELLDMDDETLMNICKNLNIALENEHSDSAEMIAAILAKQKGEN